jgi:hypothetical protein
MRRLQRTSSSAGRGAVADLGDQIARMRTVHPYAVPIVELQSAPMQTRHAKIETGPQGSWLEDCEQQHGRSQSSSG